MLTLSLIRWIDFGVKIERKTQEWNKWPNYLQPMHTANKTSFTQLLHRFATHKTTKKILKNSTFCLDLNPPNIGNLPHSTEKIYFFKNYPINFCLQLTSPQKIYFFLLGLVIWLSVVECGVVLKMVTSVWNFCFFKSAKICFIFSKGARWRKCKLGKQSVPEH